MHRFPELGMGIGLRREHFKAIAAYVDSPEISTPIAFLEVISENFMPLPSGWGDPSLRDLDRFRERFPLLLHGTSLSLGSAAPLNEAYLKGLKQLVDRYQPAMVSDHLCWGQGPSGYLHDLLPVPFHGAMLAHLSERIQRVQEILGQRILIENVSAYVTYGFSDRSEAAFLSELANTADCGLLVDLNNVYVNAINHGFDALDYLRQLPPERVGYVHLAGHHQHGSMLIDTHDQPVAEAVWALYAWATRHWGPLNTSIEWDAEIPPLATLEDTLQRARGIAQALSHPSHVALASPPALEQWQQAFAELIQNPTGILPVLKAYPEMQQWMQGPVGQALEEGLSVYAEAYFWRLQQNLQRQYLGVYTRLPSAVWMQLCAHYYHAHPPQAPYIQESGQALPEYLQAHPLPDFPFLAELAERERLRYRVLHADPSPALVPHDLSGLAALSAEAYDTLQLCLNPTACFYASSWTFMPLTGSSAEAIPCQGVVYKSGAVLQELALTPADLGFLKALSAMSLASACEQFLQDVSPESDQAADSLQKNLQHWTACGLITGFYV
jgi:uncharacterized protein